MNLKLCTALARELRAFIKKTDLTFDTLADLERFATTSVEQATRDRSPAVARFLKKQLNARKVYALLRPAIERRIRERKKLAKKRGKKKAPPRARKAAPPPAPPKRASTRAPTADDAHRALVRAAADGTSSAKDRALIADVRALMGGTRAQQDAALLELQRSGRAVLYNNDAPRNSITKHEWDGGVWLPGIERPRTIIYRDRMAGG